MLTCYICSSSPQAHGPERQTFCESKGVHLGWSPDGQASGGNAFCHAESQTLTKLTSVLGLARPSTSLP